MTSFSIQFDGGDVMVGIGQTIISAHWTAWAVALAVLFMLLAAILIVLTILFGRRRDDRA